MKIGDARARAREGRAARRATEKRARDEIEHAERLVFIRSAKGRVRGGVDGDRETGRVVPDDRFVSIV